MCIRDRPEGQQGGPAAVAAPPERQGEGTPDHGEARPTAAAKELAAAVNNVNRQYAVNVWQRLQIGPNDLQWMEVARAQKAISEEIYVSKETTWKATMGQLEQAAVNSASTKDTQRGGNEWLLAAPRCAKTTFSDTAYRILIRARLRLPIVSPNSTCSYFIRSHNRVCGERIGEVADHAHHCCPVHKIARHNHLRNLWASFYTEAGGGGACLLYTSPSPRD